MHTTCYNANKLLKEKNKYEHVLVPEEMNDREREEERERERRGVISASSLSLSNYRRAYGCPKSICGEGKRETDCVLGQYSSFHSNSLSLSPTSSSLSLSLSPSLSSRSLLLLRPIGGLGNHIYGLLSGLLISILTNRLFFIDWSGWEPHLRPCFMQWDWSSAPPELRERERKREGELHALPSPISLLDTCFDINDKKRLSLSRTSLSLSLGVPDTDDIVLHTNCPLFLSLSDNPLYRSTLLSLLPSSPLPDVPLGLQVAHVLLSTYLGVGEREWVELSEVKKKLREIEMERKRKQANKEREKERENEKERKREREIPLLGAHIREGHMCDYDGEFLPSSSLDSYISCIQSLSLSPSPASSPSLSSSPPLSSSSSPLSTAPIFIATDSERATSRLLSSFSSISLTSQGAPYHSFLVAEHGDRSHLQKAVVDLFSLSLSSLLFITPGSTFGVIASILGGVWEQRYVGDKGECLVVNLSLPPKRNGFSIASY